MLEGRYAFGEFSQSLEQVFVAETAEELGMEQEAVESFQGAIDEMNKEKPDAVLDVHDDAREAGEDFVLLDIQYNEEPTGQWYDASDGHPLLGIRNEILQGDYRSLFVIWLRFLEFKYLSEYFEEDFEEDFDEDFGFEQGFIPPNLHALSPIGQAAQDWFEVSPYWLAAVQALSPSQTVDFDAEALLAHLPPERMRAYLLMLLRDEANVKTRLLQELKAEEPTLAEKKQRRRLGALKGTLIYMAPDFDAPLEDFKDYM